jgi:hypothetical protein
MSAVGFNIPVNQTSLPSSAEEVDYSLPLLSKGLLITGVAFVAIALASVAVLCTAPWSALTAGGMVAIAFGISSGAVAPLSIALALAIRTKEIGKRLLNSAKNQSNVDTKIKMLDEAANYGNIEAMLEIYRTGSDLILESLQVPNTDQQYEQYQKGLTLVQNAVKWAPARVSDPISQILENAPELNEQLNAKFITALDQTSESKDKLRITLANYANALINKCCEKLPNIYKEPRFRIPSPITI